MATKLRLTWKALSPSARVAAILSGILLAFISCCVGLLGIASVGGTPYQDKPPSPVDSPVPVQSPTERPRQPSFEVRIVTVTQDVPFAEKTIQDSSMAKGTREIRSQGTVGKKTLTYEITISEGKEIGRRLLSEKVTLEPVPRVVAVGTREPVQPQRQEPSCDPNYSGCVPIASDVDCAGGRGNGPAYVSGPVRVVGSDIYGLDGDNDGVGCE